MRARTQAPAGTGPAAPVKGRLLWAALGALGLAALGIAAWTGYAAVAAQPIRQVEFAGELGRVARDDLERFARGVRGLDGGSASLEAVREAARGIPWVREATVRRRFPDAVVVTLRTHEPLARWGEAVLVSRRGEVFTADYEGRLPRFAGPEGAAPEMARRFEAIERAAAPLGSPVAELRLSARGAWQVALESGLVLELGRHEVEARLARFAAAWPSLADGASIGHADLRYGNGFALRRAAAEARGAARPAARKKS